MSQHIDEVLTPASVQLAMQTFTEELEREKSLGTPDPARSVTMELEQIRKGGGTVPIEIKVTFLHDAAGQPVGILGVTRDITQRKRAERHCGRARRDTGNWCNTRQRVSIKLTL